MVRTVDSLNHSLDALAAAEPAFARTIASHGRPEPRLSEPGVASLMRTIVGQQVSVAAARSMWAKLVSAFGDPPALDRRGAGARRADVVRTLAGAPDLAAEVARRGSRGRGKFHKFATRRGCG